MQDESVPCNTLPTPSSLSEDIGIQGKVIGLWKKGTHTVGHNNLLWYSRSVRNI